MKVKRAMLDSSRIEVESLENSSNFSARLQGHLNCAHLHKLTGEYSTAEQYAEKALSIAKGKHGSEHADVADCITVLGDVLSDH